jgi:hypothetical protein
LNVAGQGKHNTDVSPTSPLMQTGHAAHHAATSTLTDSASWGDNGRVVCVGVKNWSKWEIGKKHQQQVPELTICVIKGAVGPVQDEPLAHFIVSSHLQSPLNIDVVYDETDISTMLDTNNEPKQLFNDYWSPWC